MSKIGRRPIAVPAGTTVKVSGNVVEINGKRGKGSFPFATDFVVSVDAAGVQVKPKEGSVTDATSRMYGTLRAKLNNAIVGLSTGYTRNLKLEGTGYKAELKGKNLEMVLGLSHPVKTEVPAGITIKIPAESKNTVLQLESSDKDLLGQFVAQLQSYRPPEPYKGKGVRIDGVKIRQKAGKSGKGGK